MNFTRLALLSTVAMIATSPAYAQTVPSTDPAAQPDRDTAPPGGAAQTHEAVNLGNQANEPSREIIVTASRRAQSLQDVPMSVDVATGQQIQRLNIFDAKDVQQLSPGLELNNNAGRSNTATLRGIQSDPDSGSGAVVDFYFNEVPVDIQTAFTAIYDIDQIEVLRGPQGALRGRTSPAGAITLRTRRPDLNKVTGYAQATGTDDAALNLQGGISTPISPGKLALRVSGLYDRTPLNGIRNFVNGQESEGKTESVRASLAFRPIEELTINLTYQYLNARNRQLAQYVSTGTNPDLPGDGELGNRPILGVSDYGSIDEGDRFYRNRTHLVTLNADWDLGSVVLQATGGLQRTVLNQFSEIDTGNILQNFTNEQHVRVPYPIEMGEVRLLSDNPGGFFNWTVGAYYYKQGGNVTVHQKAVTYIRDAVFPVAPGVFIPVAQFDFQDIRDVDVLIPVNSRTWALSGSTRFQLTEKLRFEAAARYSNIRSVQTQIVRVTPEPFPGFNPFTRSAARKVDPITGGANLTYEPSRDLTLYAAYGRSFRSGTSAVAGPRFVSEDLLQTPDEKSDSFELGAKTSFMDRRLSLNVAAFYQKYNSFITRLGAFYDEGTTSAAPDGVVNGSDFFNYGGDVKVKGVEATFAGRPTDNWDFSISGAYTKARFDNALLPCNDFNGDGIPDSVAQTQTLPPKITGSGNVSYCKSNDRPTNVPDFSLTANSEYRFNAGVIEPFVRGLVNYRPGLTTPSGYRYRARTLLNLFAGVRGVGGGWELYGFVKNALNQKRITNDSGNEIIQPTSAVLVTDGSLVTGQPYRSGYRLINTTTPRQFGLTGTVHF